jgi:hypothetical protein
MSELKCDRWGHTRSCNNREGDCDLDQLAADPASGSAAPERPRCERYVHKKGKDGGFLYAENGGGLWTHHETEQYGGKGWCRAVEVEKLEADLAAAQGVITKLQAELAAEHETSRNDPCEQRAERYAMEASDLTKRLMECEGVITRLRIYAQHEKLCPLFQNAWTSAHCTCGLSDLLASLLS